MNPKRLWSEHDREEAAKAIHSARSVIARLSRKAPLRSPELQALDSVMAVTAEALLVFGHDVYISGTSSASDKRQP